ncbi:uncharacterized protein [Euwallacea similis]|uniref:uncharacterized protein n=1 Tax=Euwallacea similis TaxID=1736056 RepID=UPI00344E5022
MSKMSSDGDKRVEAEKLTRLSFHFGTSDFDQVVTSSAFVDKTLLVEEIINNDEMILITAPRRFGKSTNMHMLKTFLEIQVDENGQAIDPKASINYNIFKNNNLLIFQQVNFFEKHFGKYPVIHTSFKCVDGSSYNAILDDFKEALRDTFIKHKYLLKSNKLDKSQKKIFDLYCDAVKCENLTEKQIKYGLSFLSEYLYKHFNKKVFVLIDEYDAPINNALFETNVDIKKLNKLLCSIFSNTLKGNDYVCRALLTGISYFATVGLSGANNIEKFMFLNDHPFVKFYGLTETEVNDLLQKFSINEQESEQVKLKYNGYFSLSEIKLYSLWSILHYLKYKRLDNYWQKSGIVTELGDILKIPIIRYSIEIMYDTKRSYKCILLNTIELEHVQKLKRVILEPTDSQQLSLTNPSIYLTFLLQQGYITYVKEVSECECEIKIPNLEIAREFQNHLVTFYDESLNQSIDSCASAINVLSPNAEKSKFEQFVKSFQKVIAASNHKHEKNNENTFHCLLFNVLHKTHFRFDTEYTFANGRPDLILHCGNLGVIFELKFKKTSKEALKQIIDKEQNFQKISSLLSRRLDSVGFAYYAYPLKNLGFHVSCADPEPSSRGI